MITDETLAAVVTQANLAPSVHNTQPARWRLQGDTLLIAADPDAGLPVGDPTGQDAGLSCGAAVEATVLALSTHGLGAEVTDVWADNDHSSVSGHRLAARLRLTQGAAPQKLAPRLPERFTWRAEFVSETPNLFGWSRDDTVLILDAPTRDWIAALNDEVSLEIMRQRPFRKELLGWMRLSQGHPRYAHDGLSREAMQMDQSTARAARWALGPFWGLLNLLGQTKAMTAEADKTQSAPSLACFHRPADESPVASGRAYLRMWLEATSLGLAGWPMAALSDHPRSRAAICDSRGIGPDRRLVQVLRFGRPTGQMPPRSRRPLSEILL